MKKIPTIFNRDPFNRMRVTDECNNLCLWVFNNEGIATKKYDGTCCLIDNSGEYYKRREIKQGKKSCDDFILCNYDEITGKSIGWVPVYPGDKADQWHMEAYEKGLTPGTYELVGPKIQGNPEKYQTHTLLAHESAIEYKNVPRSFSGLKHWFNNKDMEGLVFKHPDGRMAKIKKKDLGISR